MTSFKELTGLSAQVLNKVVDKLKEGQTEKKKRNTSKESKCQVISKSETHIDIPTSDECISSSISSQDLNLTPTKKPFNEKLPPLDIHYTSQFETTHNLFASARRFASENNSEIATHRSLSG